MTGSLYRTFGVRLAPVAVVISAVFGALTVALPLVGAAQADHEHEHEHEHDHIRRAVQEGTILPLSAIINRAEQDHAGRLIEAELERKHGRLVYELKLVTAAGRVLELYYDARTGAPLRNKE